MRLPKGRAREIAVRMRGLAVNRIRAGNPGPRILANSIPKAGTHLLTRCLSLMPGITDSGIRVKQSHDIAFLESRLSRVGGGCFVPEHLAYATGTAQLLDDLGFCTALMIRDPRDVAVSHFHYVTYRVRNHRLHEYYDSLPDDPTRLMTTIEGVPPGPAGERPRLETIGNVFRAYLPWVDRDACLLRFEDMVGPHGGGSAETQREAVHKLASFLGIDLDEAMLNEIASRIFQRSSTTFRKGVIGDWRNHFTAEHKAAFKRQAGELLLELGYEDDLSW